MNPQLRELFLKARVLFVQDNCQVCLKWKYIIERINMEVPIEKQIIVVDGTLFNNLGIIDHPYHLLFEKFFKMYPTLFFEGIKLDGANSIGECEAFIRTRLHKDFVIERENKFLFDKKCRYERKLFGKKILMCEEK